jgi:hypothetical protein
MTPVADDLSETIHLEFDLACCDLVAAERAVAARDDAEARAHVRLCWERLDAVLDMWNDAAARPARTPVPARSARSAPRAR